MANPITDENALTGNPKAEWDIVGIGSPTIQGFAASMSVERGGQLDVKVHSPSSAWTGTVYRLGWYDGDGARAVDTITGPQTDQPNGSTDAATGRVSCANWSANATWDVSADACPGVYVIKAVRDDNPALACHVGPLVVRNPDRVAPVLVKTSDTTWQAYNHAGADPDNVLVGASIYGTGDADDFNFGQLQRSHAVSYDRPIVTRRHIDQTNIFNAEYPLLRWLERLGYDLDYVSSVDVDADPELLLGRAVVISSGHDEYWSPGMWDAFEAARDAGVNLVFLSGNEAFWHIEFAPDRRSYACWKDTHDGALNPTGDYSGTWQDTRGFNPDRRTAAMLVGQRFRLNGISAFSPAATADHAASPFWRDTAAAELTGVDVWTGPLGIVGFEGDEPADEDPEEAPANLIRLSETQESVANRLADDNGNQYDLSGTYTHAFTLYQAESGALVFGGGTNQYAWALDDTHDRFTVSKLDPDLQQALTNLLADMGALPSAVPSGLVQPTPQLPSAYSPLFVDPPSEDHMVFVAAAKNAGLDAVAGLITHISAHTAVPDNTGSNEAAGGSYARQAVTWNAASSGQVTQNGAINIPIPAGSTIFALGYWSASTSGTHYGHGLLGNSKRGFGTVDSAGVTADAIQSAGHGLSDGNRVVVYNVFAESLPTGLTEGTVYFVVSSATDTFELSTTLGGSSVNLTGQGELMWADCVPEVFGSAGTLTVASGQLVLTAQVI